ncbi:hypothetical protein Tco_1493942 [Tanacetum coccineum]
MLPDIISDATHFRGVTTLTLQRQIEKEPRFQYHFGCKDIRLSYVCFAYDLLVMCHGDTISVEGIKNALNEFSVCSGLLPNTAKSTVFFGSLNDEERDAIALVLPFGTGKLPVRLQLIAAVLESIHVYWASVFLLSVTIIKEINKLLNVKKDTLWFKWIHTMKLRGESIWKVSVDNSDSWGWKNLLNNRDLIMSNVICRIGNGNNTSIWYDNSSSIGPLYEILNHRDLYDARLKVDLKVCDMLCNEEWKWPSEWYEKFHTITSLDVPILDADKNDKLVCRSRNGSDVEFSVRTTNQYLNQQSPSVQWWKLVWGDAPEWEDIVKSLINAGNENNIRIVVRRLVFAASVYSIWQERNGIMFKDVKRVMRFISKLWIL